MTLENAKVLYKHFLEIGRTDRAENLLIRYPELKEEPKKEVKKSGNNSSNRKKG